MKEVTPYELATLASRIDPERCQEDPTGALKNALRFLELAESEMSLKAKEDKENEEGWAELTEHMENTRVDWVRGTRQITGEKRRERAARKFTAFMKDEGFSLREEGNPDLPRNLKDYKRDGFTLSDVQIFEHFFAKWKKPRKGKQGRRISRSDGRLRTELVGLVPTKPKKAA